MVAGSRLSKSGARGLASEPRKRAVKGGKGRGNARESVGGRERAGTEARLVEGGV